MPNKNLIGTFVFRNEGDGCLTSKYFHGNQPYPFVEAAKIIPNEIIGNDGFSGVYETVWIQESHEYKNAILTIEWNSNNTYSLSWSDQNGGKDFFTGIGMIYDGLLVGAYWD